MKPYKKRLIIPIDEGNNSLKLLNEFGIVLTHGYTRVVIGKRGPYVEFLPSHIDWSKFLIPEDQKYRKDNKVVYYEEWRSRDKAFVKLYLQKRTVKYADYKVDLCYISPFDLFLTTGQQVISA